MAAVNDSSLKKENQIYVSDISDGISISPASRIEAAAEILALLVLRQRGKQRFVSDPMVISVGSKMIGE